MLNTMNYSFPPTKFTKKNDEFQQLIHVMSEIEELKKEINFKMSSDGRLSIKSYDIKMWDEAMDLYQSLESLFRIGDKKNIIDSANLKLNNYRKNYERGYYE